MRILTFAAAISAVIVFIFIPLFNVASDRLENVANWRNTIKEYNCTPKQREAVKFEYDICGLECAASASVKYCTKAEAR